MPPGARRLVAERGGPTPERRASRRRAPPRPAPPRGPPTLERARASTAAVDTDWRRTSYSALIRVERAPTPASPASRSSSRWRTSRRASGRAGRGAVDAVAGDVPPTRPATRCRRRWPTLPVGATFGIAGARGARARRPRRARPARPSCSAHVDEQLCWWPVDARPPTSSPTRWSRLRDTPLGPLRRRPHAARRRRWPTGCASSTSSCRWPAATVASRGRRRAAAATSRRCCGGTCPPATRSRPTPTRWTRPGPRRPGAARLPHRLDRRRAAGARRRRRAALPRRRLQDQLAGPSRAEPLTAADYGPAELDGGDGPLRTTRCRRCSTPSCCTASCAGGCPATTPSATSAACSTSTSAACAGPDTPVVDGHPCGVFSWAPPAALVDRRSPTCSTGEVRR